MGNRRPDTRKTLYLFLGFLILFVLSFSLGVIVGRELGNHERMETVREKGYIEPPSQRVAELEKSPLVNEEGEGIVEKIPAPVRGEAESETEMGIEKPVTSETPTTNGEIAENTPLPTGVQSEKKTEPEVAEVEKTPTPTPPYNENEGAAKAEGEKGETANKRIAVLPAIQPGGKYTVQIGAFQDEEKAKRLVEPLISRGYPVFIRRVDIPGQGTWYRARVGTFKTRQDAKTYGDNLKNREPDVVKLVFITVND
ncbi:MAG TPA: SPOR domain-containing protein [Thermodesulfobacteriota bacterium]|jgi:cell division septation protein DedD|nr:SPOR domain-containing protein [Thermodesulfobacteriota bacterium]